VPKYLQNGNSSTVLLVTTLLPPCRLISAVRHVTYIDFMEIRCVEINWRHFSAFIDRNQIAENQLRASTGLTPAILLFVTNN
jgi:hypothetical protein